MKHLRGLLVLSIILLAGLIISCENPLAPFDPGVVSQQKDDTAPVVEILTPAADSIYGQSVNVSGKVSDNGGLSAVSWYTSGPLGELDSGEIALDLIAADGAFSFGFATSDYSSEITIVVTVVDWNGNVSSTSVNMSYSGSAVSSFSALAANKSVLLDWEAVDGADSYTLYYTTNGNLPSEKYTETPVVLTAPPSESLTLTGLRNGEVHVFQLKAEASDGKEWFSEYISAVPCSDHTFTPAVTGGDDSIKVEWDCVAENLGYEVWRAESLNGNYSNISGTVYSSPFYDTLALGGIRYYYKLRPVVEGGQLSGADSAELYSVTVSEFTELMSCSGNGAINDFELADNYLYAVTANSTLQVYNMNPDDPDYGSLVWEVDTAAPGLNIDVNDGIAYIAEGSAGVEIFILAVNGERCLPYLSSCYNPDDLAGFSSMAYDVELKPGDAGSLILADGNSGLVTVDTTDLFGPVTDGQFRYSSSVMNCLAIDTQYAYVVDTNQGLDFVIHKIDISTPSTPVKYSDSPFSLSEDTEAIIKIALFGPYLYVGTSSAIYVLLKNNGTQLERIETVGEVMDIEIDVDSNRMYVLEDSNSIRAIDISAPQSPVTLELKTFNRYFNCLEYNSSRLICGNLSGGFTVFGAASVGTPEEEMTLSDSSSSAIIVEGDAVYTAEYGVRRIELSGGEPTGTSEYYSTYNGSTINSYFYDVAVQNETIYACYLKNLLICNPVYPGDYVACELPDTASRVTVRGDYAYVGTDYYGLHIVDISDPSAPFIAGICNTAGKAETPILSGNIVCLADRLQGVYLIDVSDPASPFVTGLCNASDTVVDISLSGDYLAVCVSGGGNANGIEIFDISVPSSPVKVGTLSIGSDSCTDVVAVGDNIYFHNTTVDELIICCSAEQANPIIVKTVGFSDLKDFDIAGSKLYIRDGRRLKTVELSLK